MPLADYVECMNCEAVMYVEIGEDICPKCDKDGTLSWIEGEPTEKDVADDQITRRSEV